MIESCPIFLNDSIKMEEFESSIIDNQSFLKFFLFSPDGSSIISYNDGGDLYLTKFELHNLDHLKYYSDSECQTLYNKNENIFKEPKSFNIGDSICDIAWYPNMNSNDASTNCFISASNGHPINLWDSSGYLRAQYLPKNQLDELDSSLSLSFNLSGDRIYSGSKRMIRCFDVANPGRQIVDIPTCENKNSKFGQKGYISSIVFNPDFSGCFAAGSFNKQVSVFDEKSNESVLQIASLGFPVNCLRWSPCGNYLWIGCRNSSKISCWDLRNSRSEIGQVEREANSSQRMTFDLDPWGKYFSTGDKFGNIHFYDTTSFELIQTGKSYGKCCSNTVQFHPYLSLLGVANGEKVINGFESSDDEEEFFVNSSQSGIGLYSFSSNKLFI